MEIRASFEPPLSIPGKGRANIDGFEEMVFGGQPAFLQVEVIDESGARLALGLFQHLESKPGTYQLVDGSACTNDDADRHAVKIVGAKTWRQGLR